MKKILSLFLILLLSFSLVACTDAGVVSVDEAQNEIDEDGYYTSKERCNKRG